MGNLVLEKLLKALYVKEKDEYPPLIHDLRRISEKAGIELDTSRQMIWIVYQDLILMHDMMIINR